uniref:CTLH domain-containing protein n=1 Tax=Anopheles gambiae TaxID=7165 RepID=A0A1S4HCV9_ANOGA
MNPTKPKPETPSVEEWNKRLQGYPPMKESLNQLIVNYFIGAGFKEAADKFIQESNTTPTVNECSIDFRSRIIETIRQGNALEAMDLVDSFAPGLAESDRWMVFRLQQLQLIELIRAGSVEDALHYAQTVRWECPGRTQQVASEIERTMTLLLTLPQTRGTDPSSSFSTLLEQQHRDQVARTVNEALLLWDNRELPSARMEHLFKLILWAQAELERKMVQFSKLKNMAEATFEVE